MIKVGINNIWEQEDQRVMNNVTVGMSYVEKMQMV